MRSRSLRAACKMVLRCSSAASIRSGDLAFDLPDQLTKSGALVRRDLADHLFARSQSALLPQMPSSQLS